MVEDFWVSQSEGIVYFTGTADGPLERHLYSVPLFRDGPIVRITQTPGIHSVTLNVKKRCYIDTVSTTSTPPSLYFHKLPPVKNLLIGNIVEWENSGILIYQSVINRDVQELLQAPEICTIKSSDSDMDLYCMMFRPDASKFGNGPYPTMVSCYGGPHVQKVANHWKSTIDMRAQVMRSKGYLVITVDNR